MLIAAIVLLTAAGIGLELLMVRARENRERDIEMARLDRLAVERLKEADSSWRTRANAEAVWLG